MGNHIVRLDTDDQIKAGANGQVISNKLRNGRIGKSNGRVYFHRGGLYDPRIFGGLERCDCLPPGGESVIGRTCSVCHVKVMDQDQYMETYGYYALNFPYILMYKLGAFNKMLQAIGFPVRRFGDISDIWSTYWNYRKIDSPKDLDESKEVLVDRNGTYYGLSIDEELPDGDDSYSIDFVGLLGLDWCSDCKVNGQPMDWLGQYINYNMVIPTPMLRPYNTHWMNDGSVSIQYDQSNDGYVYIIDFNERILSLMDGMYPDLVDRATMCCMLNVMVNIVYESSSIVATSKESFIRNKVTTRVVRSQRANVVSALDLRPDEVYLPKSLVYETLETDIINELERNGEPGRNCKAIYANSDKEALDAMERILSSSIVSLVRNPSLHKHSLQCFKPKIWDEIAIGVNPFICQGYNMDFDGDQAWVEFYLDPADVASMSDLLSTKIWYYDKQYRTQFNLGHETVYGIHCATRKTAMVRPLIFNNLEEAEQAWKDSKIKVSDVIQIGDEKETTYGRKKLSQITGLEIENLFKSIEAETGSMPESINAKNIGWLMAAISGQGGGVDRAKALHEMQQFGNIIATFQGLGAIPFNDLYKGDSEKIKEIMASEVDPLVKKNRLREYMENEIKEQIKQIPESSSNIYDLTKSTDKVNMKALRHIYGYAVSGETRISVDNSSIFHGLSERAFMEGSVHDRDTLVLKQRITPVGGYNQRQMVNLCMPLTYKKDAISSDTEGIWIRMEDAAGRVRVDNGKRISENIHSLKGNKDMVRVKSCVMTYTDIVSPDELAMFKFPAFNDNSSIGIGFGSAVIEKFTQGGLKFKHGGDLLLVDAGAIDYITKAREDGTVTNIDDKFVTVKGLNTYRYLKTSSILFGNIEVGKELKKGDPIFQSIRREGADYNISKFNTLVGMQVAGAGDDALGSYIYTSDCFSINSGTINYHPETSTFSIGNVEYRLSEYENYLYPDGYYIEAYTRLSSGVIDLRHYYEYLLNRDKALTYFIFYEICKEIFGKDYNSEAFEVIFKCLLKDPSLSAKRVNDNKQEFIDRIYMGSGYKGLKTILESSLGDDPIANRHIEMNLGDSILVPIMLGNRYQSAKEGE